MLLHDYFRSSAAFRVRIALNLKGIAAERHFIHLRKGEQAAPDYLKINPQGLVPALVDDDHALTQSLAIIEYLEETQPTPSLLPRMPADRARVRALALAIACDIHPLNNLRVLNYLRHTLKADQPAIDAWYRHWIKEGFTAFEAMLRAPGTGRFCQGDQPGLADICLVPQVFNAKRLDCPLGDYPTLMRVFDSCMAVPAFEAARPENQPDAE